MQDVISRRGRSGVQWLIHGTGVKDASYHLDSGMAVRNSGPEGVVCNGRLVVGQ